MKRMSNRMGAVPIRGNRMGSVIDSPVYNGYIVTYPSMWVHTLDRF
ncbi:uncharacterized protein METZ01_LOCUS295568 [marine metagenome]|uniref:Uncharacterized protein n=1 Tax=marine metagenome TaxID=408172 RepID=A0A382M148_9ZZZZ